MNIPSRADWFVGENSILNVMEDKTKLIEQYMKILFNRTITMFEYEGLPSEIPIQDMQLLKQTFGYVTLIKYEDKYYAVYGALGGRLNEYYHPTKSIVANPFLNLTKEYEIDKDCIVIRNDAFYNGLYQLNLRYATLLAECDITFNKCIMNIRVDNVLVSADDSTDASIKKFFDSVKKGEFAHITSKKFLEDSLVQIHQIAQSNTPLKDLIETRNYIDGCWWMDLGLNANANMKRESLTDAEINADDKTMIPFIKQMLTEEELGWDRFNKMFGTNVKVKLSSVWSRMFKDVLTDNIESKEDVNIQDERQENLDIKEGDSNEN